MKSDRENRISMRFDWLRKLKMCSGVLVGILCISCVTTVKKDEPPLNNRILAENSAIKKRLPLIERENDVLRKENRHFRTKILNLETRLKNLESELSSLGQKYENDMTVSDFQIKELEFKIQKIDEESTKKIKTLTASNTALEKKLAREVETNRKKMASQRTSFQKEREGIITANTKRESDLSSRIESLEKKLKTKAMENDSLNRDKSELSSKLREATALAETLKKSRDVLSAEIETLKLTNARLTKVLNAQ